MNEGTPTVVICGGTAGVGRATAHEFARAGYRIGLIARSEQGLADTQSELQRLGAVTLTVSVDIADADEVERAANRIETELGPIDVWVNAAMATVFAPVSQLTAAEIKRVTEVTYLGSVHGIMAALKRMRFRNDGTIVQVGSALAYRSIPLQSAYCAAKFAIRGFVDSLRSELIRDQSKVRLTMVQLPAHNTPQFDWARNRLGKSAQPVPPIYTPEVAARAILRAARDAPREFWLGRASFQAILGNMVMPGLLDKMMAGRAYDGQIGAEDQDPDQPGNLYQSVDGLHRTNGRFDKQAADKALGLGSDTAGTLAALAVAVLATVVVWIAVWIALLIAG